MQQANSSVRVAWGKHVLVCWLGQQVANGSRHTHLVYLRSRYYVSISLPLSLCLTVPRVG